MRPDEAPERMPQEGEFREQEFFRAAHLMAMLPVLRRRADFRPEQPLAHPAAECYVHQSGGDFGQVVQRVFRGEGAPGLTPQEAWKSAKISPRCAFSSVPTWSSRSICSYPAQDLGSGLPFSPTAEACPRALLGRTPGAEPLLGAVRQFLGRRSYATICPSTTSTH